MDRLLSFNLGIGVHEVQCQIWPSLARNFAKSIASILRKRFAKISGLKIFGEIVFTLGHVAYFVPARSCFLVSLPRYATHLGRERSPMKSPVHETRVGNRHRHRSRPRLDCLREFDALEPRQLLAIAFSSLTSLGGSGTLVPGGAAIDAAGNSLVTGSYNGNTSLDASAAGQATGFTDIYVAKFTASGTPIWFRHFGNTSGSNVGSSVGKSVGVDAVGNVFVTGYYSGILDFDPAHPGTHTLSAFEGATAFALKLDPNGNFGASSYVVGTTGAKGALNQGLGLAVDAVGSATITGQFEQTLAWVYYKLGKYDRANEYITQATRTNSKNPVLLFQAGLIKKKIGAIADGSKFIKEALQTNPNISLLLKWEVEPMVAFRN